MLSKFFKKEKDSVIFTGKELVVKIPTRFGQHGCLDIGPEVTTLAIFDMIVDGKHKGGYFLPGKITMVPSNVETKLDADGSQFVIVTLNTGDVFMKQTSIVQSSSLAYVVFYEMIYSGKLPEFITYEKAGFMLDRVEEMTGINFRTDHTVVELFPAMLYRDPDNINIQYRLTDMKKKPTFVPLRLTSHAALSTTGKIVGAYMDDGIDSSLVNPNDVPSEIEDVLRQ